MKEIFKISKLDKYKLIARCIQAATGILGASVILMENHPYTAIIILAIGAIANEVVGFLKDKEPKKD